MKSRGVIAAEFLFPFVAPSAYAQSNINIQQPQDIGTQILCPIAAAMFWILISVSTIMVLYAAFMYVTARGEPEKVSKAHKTIAYSAVAIVVALIAKAFPSIIASILGQTLTGC
ncbi:MAG: hypothetical protein Q8P49_01310 [Candidatus Liptonbacteria bacterium]|nr:hypothetical protein [Candidatus Liptonbacteria bacterium]